MKLRHEAVFHFKNLRTSDQYVLFMYYLRGGGG
jgi:hypothetical protein